MEPRNKRLTISLTPFEKKLLKQVAIYEGRLSLTATIRHLILDAARKRLLSHNMQLEETRNDKVLVRDDSV